MPIIKKVLLRNFRNYKLASLENKKKHILLFGCNGAGKTNFLESVSLLSFFSNIRKAKMHNLCCINSSINTNKDYTICYSWNADFHIEHNYTQQNINISYTENQKDKKKQVFLNQKLLKNCTKEIDWMKVHWYTPTMLSFFSSEKSIRRKFLDSLAFIYHVNHASSYMEYEKLKNERLSLLIKGIYDKRWVGKIEMLMSEYASNIISNRVHTVEMLNKKILDLSLFLVIPKFFIVGESEDFFLQNSDIDSLKEFYLKKLSLSRELDKIYKRTSFGIHSSDFNAINISKKMHASDSSTGEQKIMVISIIIASLIKNKSIFLLDDASASLDKITIENIVSYINKEVGAQIIMTDVFNKYYSDKNYNNIIHDASVFLCQENQFSIL